MDIRILPSGIGESEPKRKKWLGFNHVIVAIANENALPVIDTIIATGVVVEGRVILELFWERKGKLP